MIEAGLAGFQHSPEVRTAEAALSAATGDPDQLGETPGAGPGRRQQFLEAAVSADAPIDEDGRPGYGGIGHGLAGRMSISLTSAPGGIRSASRMT